MCMADYPSILLLNMHRGDVLTDVHEETATGIFLAVLFFVVVVVLFFFLFYFIFKLYIIVLVLPNIKMNPPQVYLCSPS